MENQVSCIILDDEPFAVELLINYVEKIPFLNLIYGGGDVYLAIDLLKSQKVDLVFIDIQMPELTGIEFMEMAKKGQNFIVTSAYQEYAYESFNFNVIDYLLKPIPFTRFYKSLEKYLDRINEFSKSPMSTDLFVKSDRKIYRLPHERIIYIEGLRDYIRIHTPEERITAYENIKDIIKKLPAGKFLRIHRSYIIGIKHIRVLEGNTIVLENSARLTIGETYRQKILDYFKSLLSKKRF